MDKFNAYSSTNQHKVKGLHDCNSPMCTLSQHGYGENSRCHNICQFLFDEGQAQNRHGQSTAVYRACVDPMSLFHIPALSLSAAAIVAIADDLPARDPSCPLLPCISFDCRLQHEKIVDPIHRFAIQYATPHLAVSFLIQHVARKRAKLH